MHIYNSCNNTWVTAAVRLARSELFLRERTSVDPFNSEVQPQSILDPAAIDLPPTTSLTINIARLLHDYASAISGLDLTAMNSSHGVHGEPRIEPLLALISHSVQGAVGILELPHLRVLVLLSQKDSMSVVELANVMKLQSRRAFDLLDVMESSGWIATNSPARGLWEKITITQQGRNVVESITTKRQREIDEILGRMSEMDRTRLANAFSTFAIAARELPVASPGPGIAS